VASAAEGGEQVRGIGARLRVARERAGLSVLEIAERLHVDTRVLEALEAEQFGALDADVYVRGHLRRYAEALGESPAQLQELYVAGARAPQPDLTRIPHAPAPRHSSPLMLAALLLVVGVALTGMLWWALSLQSQSARPVAATLSAEATEAAAPTSPGGAVATPGPREGAPAAASAGGAGESHLALKFSATSWVEVSDAGGRRLLEGLIDAGTERALSGSAPLRVILGNAPAVRLQVNGRPVPLAGLVHRDGSAHLLIDEAGRATPAPRRLAHGD
jgi:cytoskeleton protein RodZ